MHDVTEPERIRAACSAAAKAGVLGLETHPDYVPRRKPLGTTGFKPATTVRLYGGGRKREIYPQP